MPWSLGAVASEGGGSQVGRGSLSGVGGHGGHQGNELVRGRDQGGRGEVAGVGGHGGLAGGLLAGVGGQVTGPQVTYPPP